MVHIAICDDEIEVGAELERILVDMLTKLNIPFEIDVLFCGEELQHKIEAETHYDLIFLDIEFSKSETNGVEVGKLIRNNYHNDKVSIVYISWEKKYSMQLFEIRPLNFIVKPLEYDAVERTVKTFLKIAKLSAGEFTYKKGHDTFKLQAKDIIYLENRERKVVIHLVDGREEEFYGSLKEAYNDQLKKLDFLFIHASYVINYDFIHTIKFKQLLLTDSLTPLPISPNKRKEVRENFFAIMAKRRV